MCEQEPSRDSYIALGTDRDRFGMRKARLHWRIGPKTWATVAAFSQTLVEEMARAGLGHLRLFDNVCADVPDHEIHLGDVNHHMGGARMSATAADGVVDDQLRLWGVPNLHVCSAAVFPTSSHSNPTLTLLALVARLADGLAAS
jgi:choline dehydrogenase-like flavoprotein